MDGLSGGSTTVGRYRIGERLAAGGMATVHIAQAFAPGGFSRVVAVKRMLPHLAADPAFATMFADEARLAARVRHPNVVPTFDVVMDGGELCIVMEYVHGASLAQLLKRLAARGERMPIPVALAIVRDALQGLHAAHEAVDDDGKPLHIVHRDVSPQNVLVGVDGIARVLDFGIAKANVRLLETRTGDALKGKLAYMAPEQLEGRPVTRACDLFAASIVLWEALTGTRLHSGDNEGEIVTKILRARPQKPSDVVRGISPALDALVMRGLARAPEERFATAREMALAIAQAGEVAPAATVGEWLEHFAGESLAERAAHVRAFDAPSDGALPSASSDAAAERTQSAVAAWTPPDAATVVDLRAGSAPPRRRPWFVAAVALATVAVLGVVAWLATSPEAVVVPAAAASAIVSAPPAASSPPPVVAPLPPAITAPAEPASAHTSDAPRRPVAPPRNVRRSAGPAIPDHL